MRPPSCTAPTHLPPVLEMPLFLVPLFEVISNFVQSRKAKKSSTSRDRDTAHSPTGVLRTGQILASGLFVAWPMSPPRPGWEEALGGSQGDHRRVVTVGAGSARPSHSQKPVPGHPHPLTSWSLSNKRPSIGSRTLQRLVRIGGGLLGLPRSKLWLERICVLSRMLGARYCCPPSPTATLAGARLLRNQDVCPEEEQLLLRECSGMFSVAQVRWLCTPHTVSGRPENPQEAGALCSSPVCR